MILIFKSVCWNVESHGRKEGSECRFSFVIAVADATIHSSRSTSFRHRAHRAIISTSTTTTYDYVHDHETITRERTRRRRRRGCSGGFAGFALTRLLEGVRFIETPAGFGHLSPPRFIFSFYYSPLLPSDRSLSLSSYSPLPSFNLYFLLPRILGIIQRAHVPHWGCTHVADYLRRQRRRATTTQNDAVARNPR